jgi:hypothetical protein
MGLAKTFKELDNKDLVDIHELAGKFLCGSILQRQYEESIDKFFGGKEAEESNIVFLVEELKLIKGVLQGWLIEYEDDIRISESSIKLAEEEKTIKLIQDRVKKNKEILKEGQDLFFKIQEELNEE